MQIKEAIEALRPLEGEVIPIRTVQETRPPEEFSMSLALDHARCVRQLTPYTADAYVAEVNVKCASKVVKYANHKHLSHRVLISFFL